MIKFTYHDKNDQKCLGLGISRRNVERLVAGQPIWVRLTEMGNLAVDGSILLFFGETEEEMTAALAEYIGPDTTVHVDPKLKP